MLLLLSLLGSASAFSLGALGGVGSSRTSNLKMGVTVKTTKPGDGKVRTGAAVGASEGDRAVLHIELDVTSAGEVMKFAPGDALGVVPRSACSRGCPSGCASACSSFTRSSSRRATSTRGARCASSPATWQSCSRASCSSPASPSAASCPSRRYRCSAWPPA